MKQAILTIKENEALTASVFRMRLEGDPGERPGGFVNLAVPGLLLRGPLSVCDYADGERTVVYKLVGRGSDA